MLGNERSTQRPIQLSREHHEAVDRRRRIVVQYDAHNETLGSDLQQWLAYRFNYIDEPGSQIDSVWWDIGFGGSSAVWPSKVRPQVSHAGLQKWWDQGIDWVAVLVQECHERGLETFWHRRISEVDIKPGGGLGMRPAEQNPVKAAHPDWVIRSWWWQGLWNLAVPEVWDYILAELREVAENYDFDGMQLDFARHMPVLPPGRQWELRGQATEFVRRVRLMLLEMEERRGRPFLLAAKVPETLEGCRIDGLDVEAWAQQNLVDIFTLGSRSMAVDIAAFRRITTGHHIKLQPCFDDHHTTDGYRFPPIEFFRGVFGNWWQQGADGICTFNWFSAVPEICARMGVRSGPASQRQAYHEVGSLETLWRKDKFYAVERRGGYPWSEGYLNRNDYAPLPATVANDGRPTSLTIRVGDPLGALAEALQQVTLRVVLFSWDAEDRLEVRLNGMVLEDPVVEPAWKDPQIFSPKPQPASGGKGDYRVDPEQKLILLTYSVPPRQFRLGENRVDLRVISRQPYRVHWPECNTVVEKLEVAVAYRHLE